MSKSPFDPLWKDRNNWRWHVFYCCKDDPRIIVPKRPKWCGRTFNFAHPKAYLVLVATMVIVCLPVVIPILTGNFPSTVFWCTFVAAIIAVVVYFYTHEMRVDQ